MNNKNIAYLGPKATFTHEASLKYFNNDNNNFMPVNKIEDVFRKVIDNEADFGVVPAENSVAGTIVDTIDLFIKTELKIFDQVTIEIRQNLISNTAKDKIKRIYSHPNSFLQCSKYIFENFRNVEFIETTSNSKAALLAKNDIESASIGPALCASEYGLKLLEENINDFEHNETKFFIISKAEPETLKEKSMIIFSVPNKPGGLFKILKIFKRNKVNMTRIESRPSKIKKWDYVFIIEFDNPKTNLKLNKLIDQLKNACVFFNYLGSY
jgi:chorismate mutase/prephenate dehydratase